MSFYESTVSFSNAYFELANHRKESKEVKECSFKLARCAGTRVHGCPSATVKWTGDGTGSFAHFSITSRQEYSNPCFLVTIRNMLTKNMAHVHSILTPTDNNPFCLLTLFPFWPHPPVSNPYSHYALHTELCCKSRSILKGSVIILFFFPLRTTQTHTTIA